MSGSFYFQTWLTNAVVFVGPFVAFYCGIVIRKIVLPGKNSPRLSHQLLLGIPVSLIVVAPFIPILSSTRQDNLSGLLMTFGIIMEHGMIVTETAVIHLRKLVGGLKA